MEDKDKDGGMFLRPPSNFFFFRKYILKGELAGFVPPQFQIRYVLFP